MKISFNTRIKKPETLQGLNGYGYATRCMLESLARLGYEVNFNDPTADVGLVFDQPQHAKFYSSQYKIIFHPWESTQLLPGWVDIMNSCDEVWTPSPVVAKWYRSDGVERPVFVYEHGIEHSWAVKNRISSTGPIKFLHVGAEATRKGGWDTVRLFRDAFLGSHDVELTIKMVNSSWNGFPRVGNVRYINETYSLWNLQQLFRNNHVYIYPSWGEGFGLTPLQAIATGMPTITVPDWAPYRDFLDPDLELGAKLAKSSWQDIHPGYMFRPSFDDIVDRLRYAFYNYEKVHEYAQHTAKLVHERYDWDTITKRVFTDLENRLK